MALHSTYWLAPGYFTYFFSYGILPPSQSVWLEGLELTPEAIGLLLGVRLIARFLGSLLIAPRVSDPSRLISALRTLALLALMFTLVFWARTNVAWLMAVMVGSGLSLLPPVPLTNVLANTWQKQITMDHGRVQLWGPVAFAIGSALASKLVSLLDYRAIPVLLSLGVASTLLGMVIRLNIQPAGENRRRENARWPAWYALMAQSWRFLACVSLLQGAYVAHYGFSAIYRQSAGYSASAIGYLRPLGVMMETIIFTLSHKLFCRLGARDLLLPSAVYGMARWGLMGWNTELPWLTVVQILHCGTFTVCCLATVHYAAARQEGEAIRLQTVYSAVMMSGSAAIITVFANYLYQNLGSGAFWVMVLVALSAIILRPKVIAQPATL